MQWVPKDGDALRLGVRQVWFVCGWQVKLCDPIVHTAISERFRAEGLHSSVDWVLSHWPISLCLDSFVFISLYFMFYFFILHMCCIVIRRWDPIFFQCFDTVGWVISPVKTCPRLTLCGFLCVNSNQPYYILNVCNSEKWMKVDLCISCEL